MQHPSCTASFVSSSEPSRRPAVDPAGTSPRRTWVQELFQGKYVNQTKCLRCETVTSREEVFFDMSLEIEHNTSVSRCLRNFR